MTWPIPTLPTNWTNGSPQVDSHPLAHNQLADAINEIAARGGFVETGVYTPTLTAIVVGTGGSAQNTASYVYVGGSRVGDKGVISVVGQWTLGTTGASVGSPCEIALPPGFAAVLSTINPPAGVINYSNGAAEYQGYAHFLGNNSRLQLYVWGVSGTLLARALIGPTQPFTWAAGHFARWSATVPVVRV